MLRCRWQAAVQFLPLTPYRCSYSMCYDPTMSSVRPFMGLVALALFGAAILLGPTDAKAHAGHKHHAVDLASAVTNNSSNTTADRTPSEQSAPEIFLSKPTPAPIITRVMQVIGKANVESARLQNRSPLSHECVPGCCDDCMACCGIAYAVGSSALLYTARFARISFTRPTTPWQHEPEAARKPPRSIV